MLSDDEIRETVAALRATHPDLVRSLLYEVAERAISKLQPTADDLRCRTPVLVDIGATLLATADLLGINADDAEAILYGAIDAATEFPPIRGRAVRIPCRPRLAPGPRRSRGG